MKLKILKRIAATILAAITLATVAATNASAFEVRDINFGYWGDYIYKRGGNFSRSDITVENEQYMPLLTRETLDRNIPSHTDGRWSYTYFNLNYIPECGETLFVFEESIGMYDAYEYAKQIVVYDFDENIVLTELQFNKNIKKFVLKVCEETAFITADTFSEITYTLTPRRIVIGDDGKTGRYVVVRSIACLPMLRVFDNRNGRDSDVVLFLNYRNCRIEVNWLTDTYATKKCGPVSESGQLRAALYSVAYKDFKYNLTWEQ